MTTNTQCAAVSRGQRGVWCELGVSRREGEQVSDTEAPGESEVIDFLRGLRGFRGTLSGLNKALLDSLVAAGLGRTSHPSPDDPLESIWAAYAAGPPGWASCRADAFGAPARSWESTAWGRAYAVRYW